jgi:8-oxo-dGTP pyrophosphatase MutT (NUDIX family)
LLVRASASGAPEPIEVYMIRRNKGMRFLANYYAFPGGKVDPADGEAASTGRCTGLDADAAERIFPGSHGLPALAWWVTAVREVLEETGVLLACDEQGQPIDTRSDAVADAVERGRKTLVSGEARFADVLVSHGWSCDLRPFRYLSHFITPRSSPIRFTARFFLVPLPARQSPRLFTEETSEAFWIHPGDAYRLFRAGEMAMAEPAEYGVGYLAQFASLDELWAAHADARHKFHGIVDRIEFWSDFDWTKNEWRADATPVAGMPRSGVGHRDVEGPPRSPSG